MQHKNIINYIINQKTQQQNHHQKQHIQQQSTAIIKNKQINKQIYKLQNHHYYHHQRSINHSLHTLNTEFFINFFILKCLPHIKQRIIAQLLHLGMGHYSYSCILYYTSNGAVFTFLFTFYDTCS